MKLAVATVFACLAASTAAFAQTADDRRWVNQCLRDNSDARVAATIVRAYCECMNNKMDDNETRSITQWERANPAAKRECERESGWN
ncbi:MAG TPA: hypothetical protein VHG27_10275 [Xanthobacteraceae bacterium]|nr:hypothetical protein [Xanthobacteraceae bacterium]